MSGAVPLYAAVDGRARRLDGDEVLFYDPALDRSHAMTLQVMQALEQCRAFQPMEAHVAAVVAAIPALRGQDAAVRRVLDGLATRGLMISDDALLQRLRPTRPSDPAAYAGHFVEADRVTAGLGPLLHSLAMREDESEPITVLAGDIPAAGQPALAEALSARLPRARFIGSERRRAIVASLQAELPEHAAALKWALGADEPGRAERAGHNLLSLLAAGRRHTRPAFDAPLEFRRHPAAVPGLRLAGPDPEALCFADLDAALGGGARPDADPVAMHLALCGHPLVDGLSQRGSAIAPGPGGLRGSVPGQHPALRAGARISVTSSGRRGAFAMAGNAWLFLLDPPSRAALLADEARYLGLRAAVPAWRGSAGHLLGEGSAAVPFCYDGSRLLPCVGAAAGADPLFEALCGVLHADSCSLELPLSLPLCGAVERGPPISFDRAQPVALNDCLADLARAVAAELQAEDPVTRLAVFCARLEDLAGASDAALLAYLREYFVHQRAGLLLRLQAVAAASPDAPRPWKVDLTALIEANGRAVVERAPPRFAGWPEDLGAGDCTAEFRRQALALTAALRAWPLAWEVALSRRDGWLAAD